jgi:hypothetical protein
VVRRRRRQRHAFTLRSPAPLAACVRAGDRAGGLDLVSPRQYVARVRRSSYVYDVAVYASLAAFRISPRSM